MTPPKGRAPPAADPVAPADPANRLRDSGLRPTPARLAVLEALTRATPHWLEAAQLVRALIPRFAHLTPATLYRALHDLWVAGLLLRGQDERNRLRYALRPDVPGPSPDPRAGPCDPPQMPAFQKNRALADTMDLDVDRAGAVCAIWSLSPFP